MPSLALTKEELQEITGYKSPTKQLNVLHRRGFMRAYISRLGVVLERAHYDAVCRGQVGTPVSKVKTANLTFLQRA